MHPLVLISLLCFFSSTLAYELRLYPPAKIYKVENNIAVDLKANDEILNQEFREYLKYGIVLHFTYFINVHLKKILFDELLLTTKIQITLKYDLWSKQYILTHHSLLKKVEKKITDINDVVIELTKLKKIRVIPLDQIKEQEHYYFKTRVTAKISQYESYFHIIFSLLSIVKYKTTYLVSSHYSGIDLLSFTNALER